MGQYYLRLRLFRLELGGSVASMGIAQILNGSRSRPSTHKFVSHVDHLQV